MTDKKASSTSGTFRKFAQHEAQVVAESLHKLAHPGKWHLPRVNHENEGFHRLHAGEAAAGLTIIASAAISGCSTLQEGAGHFSSTKDYLYDGVASQFSKGGRFIRKGLEKRSQEFMEARCKETIQEAAQGAMAKLCQGLEVAGGAYKKFNDWDRKQATRFFNDLDQMKDNKLLEALNDPNLRPFLPEDAELEYVTRQFKRRAGIQDALNKKGCGPLVLDGDLGGQTSRALNKLNAAQPKGSEKIDLDLRAIENAPFSCDEPKLSMLSPDDEIGRKYMFKDLEYMFEQFYAVAAIQNELFIRGDLIGGELITALTGNVDDRTLLAYERLQAANPGTKIALNLRSIGSADYAYDMPATRRLAVSQDQEGIMPVDHAPSDDGEASYSL